MFWWEICQPGSSGGRVRDTEDQVHPGKKRAVIVAPVDSRYPVDGCGSGLGEEVEVRVIGEAGGGGEGVGDGVAVADEDEVVDGVGVGGQGEGQGRGKEGEGEESFAHEGFPSFCFCGLRMCLWTQDAPFGRGVKMKIGPARGARVLSSDGVTGVYW
jgi:hypothetical protein